jgi:hypothetical protein
MIAPAGTGALKKSLAFLFALLAMSCLRCGPGEEVEEYKATWIRLKHTPIEEAKVGSPARVRAEVRVSDDVERVELFVHYRAGSSPYEVVEMSLLEPETYFGSIPEMERGTLVEYYIQARAGDILKVRVPSEEKAPGFSFYFKGTANRPLLLAHIILMFVSLFLLVLSGYLAFRAIRDRKVTLHVPRLAFLGAVAFFISSFPLGMIVAYQTFGKPWSGFPIGDDVTDSKSLAIVLYWAAATFFYRGSVFRKDPSDDMLPVRTLPYVYLIGVIITVALFLIPH